LLRRLPALGLLRKEPSAVAARSSSLRHRSETLHSRYLTSAFPTDQFVEAAIRRDQQRELVFLEGVESSVPRNLLKALLLFVEIEPEDTRIFALSSAFDAGRPCVIGLCPTADLLWSVIGLAELMEKHPQQVSTSAV
jgi:hypothetical protein